MTSLSQWAWRAQDHSRPRSGIPVGVAVATSEPVAVYSGCNIELGFRLGLHAEVNALSTMLAQQPKGRPARLLIAAKRHNFGPCGSCLDWIMQLNPDCLIIHEFSPGVVASAMKASEYMPFYPGE